MVAVLVWPSLRSQQGPSEGGHAGEMNATAQN